MPIEEDIGNAYASYHTHQENACNGASTRRTEFFARTLRKAYDLVLQATPVGLEREELRLMYLAKLPPGKILDVGCGNGARLVRLRALGWDVHGQEVDPDAAAEARRTSGAPVHLGHLENAEFAEGSFDVVTVSHVIEHVHDPVGLLRECRRILRVDGIVVVTTPNVESYGHARFGASWRGLEPPRHLYLFSQRTLRETAMRGGFSKCETWTSAANASAFVMGSYANEAAALSEPGGTAKLNRKVMGAVRQFAAVVDHRKNPCSGEECILKATR
jgi:2-polyprenyl-3-methyl-5-hydroxy-6-metoxy-1,4-benzoquinol methylase